MGLGQIVFVAGITGIAVFGGLEVLDALVLKPEIQDTIQNTQFAQYKDVIYRGLHIKNACLGAAFAAGAATYQTILEYRNKRRNE